jgi:mRNA-degrading endonuclease RelE of RelBE toxin-antitoxin system
MKSYKVFLTETARNDFLNLPNFVRSAARSILEELSENPYLDGAEEVQSPLTKNFQKIIVGGWSIVYKVENDNVLVYTIVRQPQEGKSPSSRQEQ